MNRTLRRFAIATWAAAAGLVAIFALFWRVAYTPPHAIWAILSTSSVLLAGAITLISGLSQVIRGPHRGLAAAATLLGTTPIVWCSLFLLNLYLENQNRKPTPMNTPTRIAAFWVESAGDVDARWRYPRWTRGKHVILHDDGQSPAPENLVAQMDEHIEQMAIRLHAAVPNHIARWVRGPLLFMRGRAIISWAICDDNNQDLVNLTSLDRHEVAHVLITALCSVDQDPPMLLCEGWAETQSKNREDLILELANATATFTLQELVGPKWYDRSEGPVYSHGAPLVVYLMEHYGPEKFLQLYGGVSSATFPDDCERILGDSWPAIEKQFWLWLESEAAAVRRTRGEDKLPPSKTADDVQFAKSMKPSDWKAIVAGYRSAWAKRPPMPKSCAFACEWIYTAPSQDSGGNSVREKDTMECVVDGDRLWQIHTMFGDKVDCIVCTPRFSASVLVSRKGILRREPHKQQAVKWALDDTERTNSADLGHYLPINPGSWYSYDTRVEAIRPPASPAQSLWEIDFVDIRPKEKDYHHHMQIDAAADWMVVSDIESSNQDRSESHHTFARIFGRKAVSETSTLSKTSAGQSTYQLRFRELNSAEAKRVREKAEQFARRYGTDRWYSSLIQPTTLAIAWPALGLLLLGQFCFAYSGRSSHNIHPVAANND
jgi:hypothetical protein